METVGWRRWDGWVVGMEVEMVREGGGEVTFKV